MSGSAPAIRALLADLECVDRTKHSWRVVNSARIIDPNDPYMELSLEKAAPEGA